MMIRNVFQFARLIAIPLFLVLAFTLFNHDTACAQASYESFARNMSTSPDIPWDLEADSVYYDRATDTYAAEGRAILSQPGRKIIADSLVMNKTEMKVAARGNVEVYVDEDILKSEAVDIDLTSETGDIKMGYIFIRKNNFHINGDNIAKTGPDEYEILDGSLTSCDGPDPDWRFESARTEITMDGYGYAYDTVFYIGSFPLFYTPFFAFPVKTSRQTGLLMPQFGVSERLGMYTTIPFFWAIDEQQDATFYAQYMTKRGLRLGGEYRYDFGSYFGAFQGDYLSDNKTDKGLNGGANRYGYNDWPYDAPRENKDRFWLRGFHKQELGSDFKLLVNLDYASDQDYLREFNNGYMSYADSRSFFLKNYHWDMDGKEDYIRTSKALVNRNFNASALNIQAVWNDDIVVRQNKEKNFTVQQLPSVTYNIRKQKIDDLPFFFTLSSEYGHYWRQDGPSAQRVDIYPRFFAPINFGLFTLEPSVGIRETYWYQYGDDLNNINNKNSHNRIMLDTRTRLSSQFNRVYDMQGFTFSDVSKLQHTMTPEIIYDYIPDVSQNKLPYFTNIDRISERNQIFASFTTAFTTKIRVTPKQPLPTVTGDRMHLNEEEVDIASDPAATFRYLEVLRFNVKQGYDFNSEQDGKNENLMPLYGYVSVQPINWLRLTADAAWSFNTDSFVSRNFSVSAWDHRGDSLFLAWRYNDNYDDPYNMGDVYPDNRLSRYYINSNSHLNAFINKDEVNTFYAAANLRITHGVDLFGSTEYNIADSTRVETNLGIRYSEQCWAVELNYRDEKDGGMSIGLFFSLLSIGDIGF